MMNTEPAPIRLQKHIVVDGDNLGEMNPCPIEYRNIFIKEIESSKLNVPPERFTVLSATAVESASPVEIDGVKVELVDYQGPATFSARSDEKLKLEIELEPKGERQRLTLRVALPKTGRNTWPYTDVEVRNSTGQTVPVRRAGIEWHTLYLILPAQRDTFTVQAVEPPNGRAKILPEEQRHTTDSTTGLQASICNWHVGRRAALSIRFDDSHPTHLSKAIPILREYNFRGTFMINPGEFPPGSWRRSAFQDHLSQWEAVAKRGDQEFANHTMHHRGAQNDEEMERQVGDASRVIWDLFPSRSKLIALNLGGGTWWVTTKTLRCYLDKYHLFDASSGSLGMDDVYGNRVAALRQHLKRHIEGAGWCRIHYHSIGDDSAVGEANFRAALDIVKGHESQLWIAGMADIHKYFTERRGATLTIESKGKSQAGLKLSCSTNAQLYNQPLTLQVILPESWPAEYVVVRNQSNTQLKMKNLSTPDGELLQFDVPPIDGEFAITR
jgi:hypothetical protein